MWIIYRGCLQDALEKCTFGKYKKGNMHETHLNFTERRVRNVNQFHLRSGRQLACLRRAIFNMTNHCVKN